MRRQAKRGMRWQLGHGRSVSFWCLENGIVLDEVVPEATWGNTSNASTSFFALEEGGLDWSKIPKVPTKIYMMIAATKAPEVNGPEDRIIWGYTANGKFELVKNYELTFPIIGLTHLQ